MARILFVDDDGNLLESFRRQFHKKLEFETANDGVNALETFRLKGPFDLVLSDLRMPGMDGIQLLKRIREGAPDTVRIMLTGQADLEAAASAVNEGNIFRFLTKPCPPEILLRAVEDGLRQHQLICAERDLLEKTLSGSVKVLTDLLAIVNPVAFGRASRVKDYANLIAKNLQFPDRWQLELAALLSQIGCITIPPETLEKRYHGHPLTDGEATMFKNHHTIGSNLLRVIPRLDLVAEMIRQIDLPLDPGAGSKPGLGAQILKAALEFDTLIGSGASKERALKSLETPEKHLDPGILAALRLLPVHEGTTVKQIVHVRDLLPYMVLAEDLKSRRGLLLASKGQPISPSLKERLQNFLLRDDIQETVTVLGRSAAAAISPGVQTNSPGH